MVRKAQAASTILDYVASRAELRGYIDKELPGWRCWLDTALVVLGTRETDELQLVRKENIIPRLEVLADKMYEELGDLGSRIGREYAQKCPYYDLSEQWPLEAVTHWPGEGPRLEKSLAFVERDPLPLTAGTKGVRPFSHAQLGNRVASRDVIGNLLALAHLKTLSRQRRGGLELRRTWAAHMVALDLAPYADGQSSPERQVLPPRYDDPSFDSGLAREGHIPLALAIVVSAYLGLPGPASPRYDAEEATLQLPTNTFAKTEEKLKEAMKQPDSDVWRIRQGVELG